MCLWFDVCCTMLQAYTLLMKLIRKKWKVNPYFDKKDLPGLVILTLTDNFKWEVMDIILKLEYLHWYLALTLATVSLLLK